MELISSLYSILIFLTKLQILWIFFKENPFSASQQIQDEDNLNWKQKNADCFITDKNVHFKNRGISVLLNFIQNM